MCLKWPPWPHRRHIIIIPWFFAWHTEQNEFTFDSPLAWLLRAMPVSISLFRRCFGPCRPRRSPFFRGGDETASPPVTMNGMSSIAASLSGACASRPSDAKNCGERWKFFSSCFVAV